MINWRCKFFNDLTINELYDLLALRQEIFIVEQNCAYLDADGKDQSSWHLLGYDAGGFLVASTRLLPAGVSYEKYASIGRVVTSSRVRGTGAGRDLMQRSLEEIGRVLGNVSIKISAQSHLRRFYESFGFEVSGDEYLEDGIPHLPMIRAAISWLETKLTA